MKTDIHIEEFHAPPGENAKLKEWPTKMKLFYKSKKQYHKLLEEQVDEFSSLQRLHYASKHLCYSAGVMILSREHPRTILYRSPSPLLTPILPQERDGVVENVVFPQGIDCRHDIGQPDWFDTYYGMDDSRIGVASMLVPQRLPTTPLPRVDAPNAIVPVVPLPAEATT